MAEQQALFDRQAVQRGRARAVKQGPALFLHEDALFEVQERLIDVNRAFTKIAIVTGFPGFWADAFPTATVVPDADVLNLDAAAHDLVIHAMCLHSANDPVGQLVQCRRALMADGLCLVAMLGGQTLVELRQALGAAEIAVTDGLSPRVAPMAEIRDLGALLQRAGFALPVADSTPRTVSYRSVLHLMRDLRAMGEANPLDARQKNFSKRDLFAEAARIYEDIFTLPDGTVRATFEMIFLTGWAPDASQQKPLRPGSALTRLADVLNTTELGADAKPVRGTEDQRR